MGKRALPTFPRLHEFDPAVRDGMNAALLQFLEFALCWGRLCSAALPVFAPSPIVRTVCNLNCYERIDRRFDGVGFHQDSQGGKPALAGRVGQPRGGGGELFQSGQNDRRRWRGLSEALPAADRKSVV